MSNNKKKKKKNNHTSATSNVQAKKQTAVQTAKPAKAQNIVFFLLPDAPYGTWLQIPVCPQS